MYRTSHLLDDLDELITKKEMLRVRQISRVYYSGLIKAFSEKHNFHRKTVFALIRKRKNGSLRDIYPYNSLLSEAMDYMERNKMKLQKEHYPKTGY